MITPGDLVSLSSNWTQEEYACQGCDSSHVHKLMTVNKKLEDICFNLRFMNMYQACINNIAHQRLRGCLHQFQRYISVSYLLTYLLTYLLNARNI